ncbi:MAG TPA: ABC transporter permease [Thermoanaerobaculia bacterium]|nr:ABC transporter permease [Thermoanaerobaculia bacterium]
MYDLRYALRSLARAPGFAAAAILTLAIAIGANTAMFSILYGVVLQPLAFQDPDRVVRIFETDKKDASFREQASIPDFEDWKAQQRVFSRIAAMTSRTANITTWNGDAEQVAGLGVSHDFFALLGVKPVAGRAFVPADDRPGAEPVVILNEAMWRSRYGASQNILGSTVTLDGTRYEVIGVMPARTALSRAAAPQFWIPLALVNPVFGNERGVRNIHVIGRLNDGVSLRQAQSAMDVIAARLEQQYPQANAARGAFVEPALDFVVREARPRLFILSAAVLAVLFIACINVAGLMLARADARARELAVRASIGASRGRLVRQLLTESIVVSLVGGTAGFALAWWLTRMIVAFAPALPRAQNIEINLPVLLFAIGASVASAILFGVIPAIRSSRVQPATVLAGSRGVLRATNSAGRGALVIVEVALAVVLVIGAGLLLKSFSRLMDVDLGVQTSRIVTFSMSLPTAKYPQPPDDQYPRWPEVVQFVDNLTERARAIPGVQSAAVGVHHPLRDGFSSQFEIVGAPRKEGPLDVRVRPVGAGYVETLGMTVLRGRTFTRDDRLNAPRVAIINEPLARKYFPNGNPVGQQVHFWGAKRTIIAVIEGERFGGPASETAPALYVPIPQIPMSFLTLIVRTSETPGKMIGAVRGAIRSIDGDLALSDVGTLDDAISQSVATPRFQAVLITSFGAIALLLAAIGLYALIAYQVQQRTNEIGVRMALGASASEVARLVLRRAARLAAIGVALGLAGAFFTRKFLETVLFQISATDPAIYVSVPLLLAVIVLLASYVPARRAMRVDPAVALRSE